MKGHARSHLLLLGVMVVWSFAFMGIKNLLGQLEPMLLNQGRFAFATLVFLPMLVIRRSKHPRVGPRDAGLLVVLASLSAFGYFLALNYGERYVPSGITALLVSTSPLFTLALAVIFLKEKVSATQGAGFLLAFFGLFLVVYLGTPRESGGEVYKGAALLLLAAISWGGYTVLMKSMTRRLDPLQVTGYSSVIGFLLMLPFTSSGTGQQLASLTAGQWAWLAYLGLACTSLGVFIYNYALSDLEASRASAYIYLVPVLSLFWGWLFLDEAANAFVLLGASTVIGGLLLVEGKNLLPRRDEEAELPPGNV
jgi:drug/metabolite transporter (DMT)-like permease